jgi:DNA-binding MarR family transcriptional regulator
VGQLVGHGWVQRAPDPADGRALLLSLTPEGQRIATELAAARRARFERLLHAIPAAQRDAIARALGLLVEAIDASRQE